MAKKQIAKYYYYSSTMLSDILPLHEMSLLKLYRENIIFVFLSITIGLEICQKLFSIVLNAILMF